MSEQPIARLDDITVRRWLTAIALSATAEDLSSRLSPVNAAVALVGADTAAEAVLGILADRSRVASGKRDAHEELLSRAMTAAAAVNVELDPTLVRAIRLTHQRRNSVVHQGDDATPRDVEDAIVVVRGLLQVLSNVLPRLTALPPGAGLLRAVASVIDAPELAERLLVAEDQLVAGEWKAALEHSAIALAMALQRASPPLPHEDDTMHHRMSRQLDRDVGRALDDAWKAFDSTGRRIGILASWVVPMALGMSPREYARLVALAPPAYQTMDSVWHAYVNPSATEADARWALPELARVVFRLWEMRALLAGDQQAVALELASARYGIR